MNFLTNNWILFVLLIMLLVLVTGLYAAAISMVVNEINNDDADDSRRLHASKRWILGHQSVKIVLLVLSPLLVVLFGLRLIGTVFELLFGEVIPDATSASARFFAKK